MGIRPPSLYVYFDSKNALYDALFERGANLVVDCMQAFGDELDETLSLEESLLASANAFIRWAVEHPEYTQLLFWRPVPGFTPSERAYAPAIRLLELSRERFSALQSRGLIRDDVSLDDLQRHWTIVTSGVISQQLANAPDQSFESGAFTTAIPDVVAMFAKHYASAKSQRSARHANKR
jgi:AcrR family transcriptional regulator